MSQRKSKIPTLKESPLFWPARLKGKTLCVLDETLIPSRIKYIKVRNTQEAVKVIRQMKTRAFGQFLVVLKTFLMEIKKGSKQSDKQLLAKIKRTAASLNQGRPTFPFSEVTSIVVGWGAYALAHDLKVSEFVTKNISGYLSGVRMRRLQRVVQIADVIKYNDSILTHCNVSGELAMAAYLCKKQKKVVHFFVTETRPYMQGAKLTCWELQRMGAHCILIPDNAVGAVMADKFVNKVIVGSDRSCANGDFANKIGTYQIAVLAKEFGIPFYVLTQPSKKIRRGEDIPIEVREEKELLQYEGKRTFPKGVKGFYPGFDVIPNKYITKVIAINVNG